MQTLKLTRTIVSKSETLGQLILLNSRNRAIFSCTTLERPYLGNQVNISCIPPGTYRVGKNVSAKLGRTLWIKYVPGRSEILIHKGNTVRDTSGCVLVGMQINYSVGLDRPFIDNSTATMSKLFDLCEDELLIIIS